MVQDLVDQAHGVQGSGRDGFFRKTRQVALLVQLLRENADRLEIGQDHVAGYGEKRLVELKTTATGPGNVKFLPRTGLAARPRLRALQLGEAQAQAQGA